MIRLTSLLIFALAAVLLIYGQDTDGVTAAQPAPAEQAEQTSDVASSAPQPQETPLIVTPTLRPARVNTPHLIQITTTDAPEDVLLERNGSWFVTGERVNMRSGPSTQNRVVSSLTRGETVNVIGFNGNWAHLQVISNGQEGYMSRRYLSTTQP